MKTPFQGPCICRQFFEVFGKRGEGFAGWGVVFWNIGGRQEPLQFCQAFMRDNDGDSQGFVFKGG